MRLIVFVLVIASMVFAQSLPEASGPILLTFVAPAYPRVAKEKRMQGTAVTEITIANPTAVVITGGIGNVVSGAGATGTD